MEKHFENLESLLEQVEIYKGKNQIIGLTNGCFDLLHDGHKKLINESKQYCNFLIVAINSDESVKKLKGYNRPFDNINKRIEKLKILPSVDAIISFNTETPENIISKIIPHILFKGSDYNGKYIAGSDLVIKNGGEIKFIEILKGVSTTIISQRVC
jgi:rfaE bifunctional protein nucleotidyltransferase chain/domain